MAFILLKFSNYSTNGALCYGPGVDSVSNRNMYQEYFLGSEGRPVRRADNLTTFMYLTVLEYGSLNLLEPSGPVQACNGVALWCVMCAAGDEIAKCCLEFKLRGFHKASLHLKSLHWCIKAQSKSV